jgi:hypothetical protein
MKKHFTICIAIILLFTGATNAYCAKPVSIRFQSEESSLRVYKKDVKRYCANFCKKLAGPSIRGCVKAGMVFSKCKMLNR